MCDEWMNFEGFYKWATNSGYDENAPYGEYTIERINVNKGYCPENCKWISISDQQLNRRNNHFITYNDETKTIKEWSEKLNIPYSRLESRILHGWEIEDAFYKPRGYRYKDKHKGE